MVAWTPEAQLQMLDQVDRLEAKLRTVFPGAKVTAIDWEPEDDVAERLRLRAEMVTDGAGGEMVFRVLDHVATPRSPRRRRR